jgi:hypothetical protein
MCWPRISAYARFAWYYRSQNLWSLSKPFHLPLLKGTGIVAKQRTILQDSRNSWDKMSQESDGEWIVHLPDLGSYLEYIDTNIELFQKFPDVQYVVDPKVRVVKETSEKE